MVEDTIAALEVYCFVISAARLLEGAAALCVNIWGRSKQRIILLPSTPIHYPPSL